MKLLIYENPENSNDKIEFVVEFSPKCTDDSKKYYNNIINNDANERFKDYNNKIYFTPQETEKYIITVASDYEGEEGEYSLIIKEAEDVSTSLYKKLLLNEDQNLKFKKKYMSQKFTINLNMNKTYNLSSNKYGLNMYIFGEGNIFSNHNNLEIIFTTIIGGEYLIEIVAADSNHTNSIKLSEISSMFDKKDDKLITYYSDNISITEDDSFNESNDSLVSEDEILNEESEFYDEDNLHDAILMKDRFCSDIYSLHIENGELVLQKLEI
jgi:hypothetical protein